MLREVGIVYASRDFTRPPMRGSWFAKQCSMINILRRAMPTTSTNSIYLDYIASLLRLYYQYNLQVLTTLYQQSQRGGMKAA